MRLLLSPLLLFFLSQGPAHAQEEDYDIPPPPPMMEDFDEGMIEEIPPDEYIDGPVYEAPPDDPAANDQPPSTLPQPNNPSRFGFAGPGGGDGGRPSFRGRDPRQSGSGPKGGGSFGETTGKVRFEIVDGVFWEKGKKRTRGEK